MPLEPIQRQILAQGHIESRKEVPVSGTESGVRTRMRMKEGSTVAIELLDAAGQVLAVEMQHWEQGKLSESTFLDADGNHLSTVEYQWCLEKGDPRVYQLVLKNPDGAEVKQAHLESGKVSDRSAPYYPVVPAANNVPVVKQPYSPEPVRFVTSVVPAALLFAWAIPNIITGMLLGGGLQMVLSLLLFWNAFRRGPVGLREQLENLWSWVDSRDAAKTFVIWSEGAFQSGNQVEGERLLERALQIDQSQFNQAVCLLQRQGVACLKSNKLDEAERQLLRALQIHREQKLNLLGTAAECCDGLAEIYRLRQQPAKAIEFRKQQVKYTNSLAGSDRSFRYAAALCSLGELYLEVEAYGEAEALFKQAVDVGNSVVLSDESTAWYSMQLGHCHLRNGKYSEAEYLFRKSWELLGRSDCQCAARLALCRYGWAASCAGQGKRREAEELFEKAAESYQIEQSQGGNPARMRECFQAYAEFLRQDKREAEAQRWERQLKF